MSEKITPVYDASAPLAAMEQRAARADAIGTVPDWYLTAFVATRVALKSLVERCVGTDINTDFARELLSYTDKEAWEKYWDDFYSNRRVQG